MHFIDCSLRNDGDPAESLMKQYKSSLSSNHNHNNNDIRHFHLRPGRCKKLESMSYQKLLDV